MIEKLQKTFSEVLREGPIGIYLMAFLIPLYANLLGLVVLIIALELIIRKTPIVKERVLKNLSWRNPGLWLFLFYSMHLVGLIHTENLDFAYMDLGMKATLGVFPIIFLLYQPKIEWDIFVKAFIFGVLVSILINSIFSFGVYLETHHMHDLKGSRLSHLMHRGYWAVYMAIAYFFLLKFLLKRKSVYTMIFNVLIALVVFAFIVLSESKVGVIVAVVLTIWAGLSFIYNLKNKWLLPVVVLSFLAIGFTAYQMDSSFGKRFDNAIRATLKPFDKLDKTSGESTTVRRFVWHSSLELIQDNFWFGVGTGDIKDELKEQNKKNGYTAAVANNLNSHNQFFNSHIALGVFGSLFLLLTIATNLIKRKEGDNYYAWRVGIVLILFFALLPESMLEVQAGIIPYAFLLTFLTAFRPKSKEEHNVI